MFLFFSFLFSFSFCKRIRPIIKDNSTLRSELKRLYGDHTNRDYGSSRRQMYAHTDCENGKLRLIYGNNYYDWKCGTESIPSATYVNAEHCIPQSTFGKSRPMVSDLHHLISSPAKVNNARSNYKFGEFDYSECSKWCKDNNCDNNEPSDDQKDEYSCLRDSPKTWMPAKGDRGQVARAVLYFYTIYPDYKINTVGDVDTFKKWNREYPPQAHEIARNNAINRSQGNRNPYIDDPSLGDLAW